MAKVHHYDLGDAVLRINENETDGYLLTIVQLDNPFGVVKLLEAQTHKLIDCLLAWSGAPAAGDAATVDSAIGQMVEAQAEVHRLKEELAAAQAENDLAQAEIARLSDAKPKRTRKKADEPPVEWDVVHAAPATSEGGTEDDLPGFAIGDEVEVIATTARAKVDRVFADNPRKVQVMLGGTMPKVFDVTELRLVVEAPNGSDLKEAWSHPDPVQLRQALYEDSKQFGFSVDEMRDLVRDVTGKQVTTRELDVAELQACLKAVHDRSRSKLPF